MKDSAPRTFRDGWRITDADGKRRFEIHDTSKRPSFGRLQLVGLTLLRVDLYRRSGGVASGDPATHG